MPELPEVENVIRSLRPGLVGRRILDVELPPLGRNGRGGTILQRILTDPPEEFRNRLLGGRVEAIRRHGKNLLITICPDGSDSGKLCLLVHLGMTGRLQFEGSPEPRRPHTHLIFSLDAPGRWLHYSDSRRFGKLRLTGEPAAELQQLGPDPLEISGKEFYARLHRRRAMLKSLLLDQRFLRGLGNIYADESLFRAGIHPAALGARLSHEQALRLYRAIRSTLRDAIELGGSSISSYVNAAGRPGRFQQVHQVYQRTGERCFRCGSPIRRCVIASRSTHYCPGCQRGGRRRMITYMRSGKRNH